MWKRWINFLAFTPTERKVLLFLAATILVGSAIRAFQGTGNAEKSFDYSISDSTFESLSSIDPGPKPEIRLILDINTATKEELVRLPGIGEVTAERILLYREEQGKFHKTEDLMNVRGIGKKKFEQLKSLITVN